MIRAATRVASSRAGDLAALALVCAGAILAWTRFSTAGAEIPGRAPFRLTSDFFNYYIPMTEAAGARLRAGSLPLWNPEACSGIPFMATAQAAVFYPGTWLAALVPAHELLPALALGHCVLGGCFAYGALRAWDCTRAAAAIGALLFVVSCCLGQTLWPPAVATICWVPFQLWAAEKILQGGGVRWWMGLACAGALQLFAGFPQYLIYGYAFMLPVVAVRLFGLRRKAALEASTLARRAVGIVAALALGLCLAAIQWLPTAELIAESARGGVLSPAQVHYLHPRPQFTSSGEVIANAVDGRAAAIGFGEPGSGYLGPAVVLLVALALVLRRRDPLVWLLLALGGSFLVLSDGYFGRLPGVYATFTGLPLVGSLRTPERLRLVTSLCLVALAAIGATAAVGAAAREGPRRAATLALAACGTLLALASFARLDAAAFARPLVTLAVSVALCLALVRVRSRDAQRLFGVLLFVVVAVDLGLSIETRATIRRIPDAWVGNFRSGADVLSRARLNELRAAAGHGRLVLDGMLPFTGGGDTAGVRRVACYEPLVPAQWSQLARALGQDRLGGLASAMLRGPGAAQVRDLTSVRGTVVAEAGSFQLIENGSAMPRAYFLVPTRIAGREETIERLAAGELLIRQETLVDREPSERSRSAIDQPPAANSGPLAARIALDLPERVVVEVDSPSR